MRLLSDRKSMEFNGSSTLAQQCYEQLLEDIIKGTLKPGEKLKVEPIKQRFGIGQSPVREALSRLVASGLVETEDNKGFRVTQLSEADIRDTYATYTSIELLALNLAMERGDDAWQARIVSALYALGLIENKKEPVPYSLWAERNYNFHVALISGCNSPSLLAIRSNVYLKFDRYCRIAFQTTKDSLDANHEEHKKLAQAVVQRDVKKVEKLMTYHINGALEEVIALLKSHNLLEDTHGK